MEDESIAERVSNFWRSSNASIHASSETMIELLAWSLPIRRVSLRWKTNTKVMYLRAVNVKPLLVNVTDPKKWRVKNNPRQFTHCMVVHLTYLAPTAGEFNDAEEKCLSSFRRRVHWSILTKILVKRIIHSLEQFMCSEWVCRWICDPIEFTESAPAKFAILLEEKRMIDSFTVYVTGGVLLVLQYVLPLMKSIKKGRYRSGATMTCRWSLSVQTRWSEVDYKET